MLCTPFALFGWNKCHNHNPVDCSFSQMRCQEKRLFQIQTVFACLLWQQTLLLEQETEAFQERQALVLPLCAADGRLGGQPGRRQTGEQGTGDRKGEEEGAGHDKGRPLAKPQFRQGAP